MKKEKIIAFLEGTLSAEEQAVMSAKIAKDISLAKQVAAVRADWELEQLVGKAFIKTKMDTWQPKASTDDVVFFPLKKNREPILAKEADFVNRLKNAKKDKEEKPTITKVVPLWRKFARPLAIAASFLLLLTVGQQWLTTNLSDEALFSDYYKNDLSLNQLKGGAAENNLAGIKNLIQNGQLATAVEKGKELLATTADAPEQIKINYLLGQTFQRQKDYGQAINYFEAAEKMAVGENKKEIQINVILLHMLNQNKDAALTKIQTIKDKEATNLGAKDIEKLETIERKLTHPLRFLAK